MEPMLKKLPQLRRNLLFVPVALGAALVAFLLVGVPTNAIAVALLLAPFAGVGTAWFLLGWPVVTRKDGTPIVSDRAKPWFFFLLFPVYAGFLYPFLGLALTPFLPAALVVYVPLGVAVVGGGVGAYVTAGFPNLGSDVRQGWARIPPKTKPWLSIPAGLFLSLVFYFLLGWLITTYLGATWAPLAALPVGVILGFGLAIFLFGVPKPEKSVRELVPRPPGNARPGLLLGTWLLLGGPFAFAVGLLLGFVPLPGAYVLPASLLLGFLLAFGAAVLVWGLPGRWAKLPDYTPGLSSEVRVALVLPITFAVAAVVAVGAGYAGAPVVAALLLGLLVGLAVALAATGAWRNLRGATSLRVPEKVKPLLLFPTWFVVALALFVPLTYFLPGLFAVNLVVAAASGLVVAFLLVERDVVDEMRASWQARRDLAREVAAIRNAKPATSAAPPPEAVAPAREKRSLRALFSRKKKD